MKIIFKAAEENHIAKDVKFESGRLVFHHKGAEKFLIVIAPLASRINLNEEVFQARITDSAAVLENGVQFELEDGVYKVQTISRADYTRNGFAVPNIPAAFGVLACISEGPGSVIIYVPSENSRYHLHHNIQKVICTVAPEIVIKKTLFKQQEEKTGFYQNNIKFEGDYIEGLYYKIEGVPYKYPVTEDMARTPFFTEKAPAYFTDSVGIKLEQNNG
jgi:hypothetical protein